MAASQTEEIDVLWGISPDPFPFQSPLKEMQVTTSSNQIFSSFCYQPSSNVLLYA